MNKYDMEFLKEIGLDQLDESKQSEIMNKLEDLYQKFLLLELTDQLSDTEIDSIQEFSSTEELESFLESKGVDYRLVSQNVAFAIKQFVKENMLYLQGYIDSSIDNNS